MCEAVLQILCNTVVLQKFTILLLFTASRNVAILGYVTFNNISFYCEFTHFVLLFICKECSLYDD